MKYKKSKFQIILLLLCISCSSHSTHSSFQKNFDQVVRISSYSGKMYPPLKPIDKFGKGKSFQLGQLYRIINVGDYIIVSDEANKTIHLFNGTTQIKSIGRYGRGPGEFQDVGALQSEPEDSSFWVYDPILFRFQKFNLNPIDSSGDKKHIQKIVNIETKKTGYLNRPVWLNDTTIVSHGLFSSGRIAFFNAEGRIQKNIGPTLPGKDNKNVPYKVRSHAYMGFMAAKPDGSAFVIADQYTDKIEIYNSDGRPRMLIVGARNFEPHYTIAHPRGQSIMASGENTRWAYIAVCATNRRIYTLYSGKLQKSRHANFGHSLHIFNWKGKLLGVYPFKKKDAMIDISVDKTQEKLYALNFFAKQPITVYKLPENHSQNEKKQ